MLVIALVFSFFLIGSCPEPHIWHEVNYIMVLLENAIASFLDCSDTGVFVLLENAVSDLNNDFRDLATPDMSHRYLRCLGHTTVWHTIRFGDTVREI